MKATGDLQAREHRSESPPSERKRPSGEQQINDQQTDGPNGRSWERDPKRRHLHDCKQPDLSGNAFFEANRNNPFPGDVRALRK